MQLRRIQDLIGGNSTCLKNQSRKRKSYSTCFRSVDSQADRIEKIGKIVIQSAHLSRDVAGPLREIITQIPADSFPTNQLDREIESWKSWHNMANEFETSATLANSFGAAASGTANTAMSTVWILPPIQADSTDIQPVIDAEKTKLFQILERSPLVEEVKRSMCRLGLDKRGGNSRTPLELLEEAQGALDRPVIQGGGPTTVLIPLRECIDAVITELVRRRPKQEPVKGWSGKVVSVGRHCAHPGLKLDHFDRIGADVEILMNQLSGAKQTSMNREELNRFFHRGTLFLKALMDSIDESLLKPS